MRPTNPSSDAGSADSPEPTHPPDPANHPAEPASASVPLAANDAVPGAAGSDEQTTLAALRDRIRAFTRERDWEQFHHPKDLGVALATELGEVLEHFRYRTHEQIAAKLTEADYRRELGYELADMLWLLLRLADVCGIDLSTALVEKLALAAKKYPADLVRGRSDKYTAYRSSAET